MSAVTGENPPALGVRANWAQFALLVLVNAFVGAMAGLERSTLSLVAASEFGLIFHTGIVAFLVSFGTVKAFTNAATGALADRYGRKRLLVAGWIFALPVPFLLAWAPSWGWIIAANALLGVQQGLCWSSAVIMKIDLAGPRRRGLAMGLNECAGYVAVALTAYLTAVLAAEHGLRAPFLLGAGIASVGLLLSALAVRDTGAHARHEAAAADASGAKAPRFRYLDEIVAHVSWKDRSLFACCQAGFVNNLNDALVWALFPLLYAALGFGIEEIGVLAAVYPATWGVGQLLAGPLSDRVGRKWPIVVGMTLQAAALAWAATDIALAGAAASAALLGVGTALVYPTLLAAVGDHAHPSWRATAVGVYRFWRDLGYAAGALAAGVLADLAGLHSAVWAVAILTFVSGLVTAWKYRA